jgi:co-chaperonin GroES (HSP10)
MIKPLRDVLVLRVLQQDTTKIGSLYMPQTGDAALANNVECEVLAAGPGMYRHAKPWQTGKPEPAKYWQPMTTKQGDRVLIKCYDGHPAGEKIRNPDDENETLLLIRERDLVGILVA